MKTVTSGASVHVHFSRSRAIVSAALLLGVSALSGGWRAPDCSSRGNVSFICGLSGPEDLVHVPGTPWVVVSAVQSGPLHAVNTRSRAAVAVYPSPASRQRFDAKTYGSCPGPFDVPPGGRSITHGVNVRAGRSGIHTLYVVHHGFRESIEVFDIEARSNPPRLTWVGCILAPKGAILNGVAPLPDGGLVATEPHRTGMDDMPNAMNGKVTGEVHEWHADRGWSPVPGSAGPGPNGIEVSRDGRWLYIAQWPVKKIIRLSRGLPKVERTSVDLSFHPDNLRWQTDGSLLTGGHYAPTREEVQPCMNKSCAGAAAHVARIDPRTLAAKEIVSYPSNDAFFAGTAALQVGKEIWIGSFRGDRIARYPEVSAK